MLKKERQKKQFDQAWKAMLFRLRGFYAGRHPEALHRFRVQAKKVHTLLVYLQGGSNKEAVQKTFLPVRFIFKEAGQIRSIQVHLALLAQAGCPNVPFVRRQKSALIRATKKFCTQQKSNTETIENLCNELAGNFHNLKKKRIVRLFKKKLNKLARFFSGGNDDTARLHKTRKTIKRLLFLHASMPLRLLRSLQINTAYLKKLEEHIGAWHDMKTTVELVVTADNADQATLNRLNRQERELKKALRALAGGFDLKVVL